MTQVVVEETIMAVAKWLVNLVNRTLEAKPTPPKPEPEPPTSTAPSSSAAVNPGSNAHPTENGQVSAVDQLLAKFSCLIEESCDRTQAIALLENRLQGIESALQASRAYEESIQILSQAVVKLDSRLSHVEQVLEQVDLEQVAEAITVSSENKARLQTWVQTSSEQMTSLNNRLESVETTVEVVQEHRAELDKVPETAQPAIQQLTVLEGRIVYLEKLVARLSLVPKFVENNYRSITSLQDHIKRLNNKVPATNGHKSQDG